MNIHLLSDLESLIQATVLSGQFASVDEAMATAARLLLKQIGQLSPAAKVSQTMNAGMGSIGASQAEAVSPDPLLGLWGDYADEMDEIVAGAYRRRQLPWREIDC